MLYHIETEERTAGGHTGPVYTLLEGNGRSRAEIWAGHGFNCVSWQIATADGLKEVLYRASDWETHPIPTRSGIPILFPFPNRIRDGRYRFGSKQYQLPLNDAVHRNGIHGFAPRHAWQVFGYNSDTHEAWVHGDFQPSKDAPETTALWPADYLLSVVYRLRENTLRIEMMVRTLDQLPVPFGIGLHPYFRFPCNDEDISRYRLHAPARSIWETIDNLPTGQRLPVPDQLNYNSPRHIGATQLDTLYTDLGAMSNGHDSLLLRAELGHEELPGSVQVWTTADFRESVLFTPPHRQAICIEPYTCATDAINLQDRGIDSGWKVLDPGNVWQGTVELRWNPEGDV